MITAGGRVGPEYAALAKTEIKALAPVRGKTSLARTLDAVAACNLARVAVVGGEDVRTACVKRVERIIDEGLTGGANVMRALRAWNDDAPLLYLTSDLPYITSAALHDFITRVPNDAICMPLCEHAAYSTRFPGAPAAGITLAGVCVVNGGAFYLPSGSARRVERIAMQLFDARKAAWRMARVLGPAFFVKLALQRLSIAELERRAASAFGVPALALRHCAPELAFDVDTLGDYRYARDHA